MQISTGSKVRVNGQAGIVTKIETDNSFGLGQPLPVPLAIIVNLEVGQAHDEAHEGGEKRFPLPLPNGIRFEEP
jgi:hypothetical protein